MRFRHRRKNSWIGLGAGLLGGIAGSIAMGPVLQLWSKLTKSNLLEEGMQSTTRAASAVSEKVFRHRLSKAGKPRAAQAVHYGFGASMGALYGAASAWRPASSAGCGALFGAGVYLAAHAGAVPAMGLGKPVTRKPLLDEAGELLGHIVYGVVADLTRRGVMIAARSL